MFKRRMKKYLPYLFQDEEVNATYVTNQQTIIHNQKLIMERMRLEWDAPIGKEKQKDSVDKRRHLLGSQSTTHSYVQFAGKPTLLRRLLHMSTINKAILIPLLSAIALFIKQSFGYEISEEWINVAADVILYIIFSWDYL